MFTPCAARRSSVNAGKSKEETLRCNEGEHLVHLSHHTVFGKECIQVRNVMRALTEFNFQLLFSPDRKMHCISKRGLWLQKCECLDFVQDTVKGMHTFDGRSE